MGPGAGRGRACVPHGCSKKRARFSQGAGAGGLPGPHIAQILKDLGQAGRIAALTRQDLVYHAGIRAVNAGSYFSPDIAALEGSRPDLIICTPSQAGKIRAGLSLEIPVMVMAAASMDQAFNQVRDLGRLFGCEAKAAGVLEDIRTRLDMVAGRLAAEEEK